MKKTILFALSLTLLLGCTACSKKDQKTDNAENTSAVTTHATETEGGADTLTEGADYEPETSNTVQTPDEGVLSVYTENFVNGECSVTLSYPRYGDGEHDLFDISMRNFAMTEYNQSGMMPEDNALYEVTSCEIKYESEYFVSAVVKGHIINNTSAHDSYFAYTVNADPRTGRVYLSEELIGDLDSLKAAVADGSFDQSFGVDILANGVTPDSITQSWRSDYGVFPDMYFTDGTFGVVAELPHVLGGYAGFEIPYAETENMINPVAKGLVGLVVTTD